MTETKSTHEAELAIDTIINELTGERSDLELANGFISILRLSLIPTNTEVYVDQVSEVLLQTLGTDIEGAVEIENRVWEALNA